MRGWGILGTGVLVLVASGCAAEPGRATADEGSARLDRIAALSAEELVEEVGRSYDETVMRVQVTRTAPEEGELSYTFVASRAGWRAEWPGADEGDAAEAPATLLAVEGQVCFDRGFRPRVTSLLAESYGVTEFDPAHWSCSDTRFGLNPMATFELEREDPRWRIDNLAVDRPGYSARVEELDGESLVHVRMAGVTRDGPLDPERPAYDLWVDEERLPVLMETDGLRWEFAYDDGLARDLTTPAEDERGSYGYAQGPGSADVRACVQDRRTCPTDPVVLTWGDGRTSG